MMQLLFIILCLLLAYLFYQLYRNDKVYEIRSKWIWSLDERYDQYSYDEMFLPSHKNWFGLKPPIDKDFKIKQL